MKNNKNGQRKSQPERLIPLTGDRNIQSSEGIQVTLLEYIELVDWTGCQIRKDKRGAIESSMPNILNRLEIESENWLKLSQQFESSFKVFAGSAVLLEKLRDTLGALRMPGLGFARIVFGTT